MNFIWILPFVIAALSMVFLWVYPGGAGRGSAVVTDELLTGASSLQPQADEGEIKFY